MPDETNLPFLTRVRHAIWRSIREYEWLKGNGVADTRFQTAYLWESAGAEIRADKLPPAIGRMPAIDIRNGVGDSTEKTEAYTYLVKQFVQVTLWTPWHRIDLAEELWQLVWEAVAQVPLKTRPYLYDVTGSTPEMVYPVMEFIAVEQEIFLTDQGFPARTDGNPATQTTFSVLAEHRTDPRTTRTKAFG